jgi:hypothetical protein
MTARSRRIQSALAGLGGFLVTIWPVLLIALAGASGSVGDLSQVHSLGVGVLYAIGIGLGAGWLMDHALRWVATTADRRTGDAWGAYALALGVYTFVLTAVPALIYLALLGDEDRSLHDRFWVIAAVWVGGNVLAAILGALAGALLLRGRHPVTRGSASPPSPAS